jgi:serine/threonine protein kinase
VDTRHPTAFERCALASGLLKQDQLDRAWAALRASDDRPPEPPTSASDRRLADVLVELGLLNRWQAKQLFEGRTKFNLGPYWMVDSLGRGGMGQVFKAQHSVLRRFVAVKVLPRSKSTPQAIANFTREIHILANLDHPNLVKALDAGEDGNVYYLVTEFVPGRDLRKLVRRSGPLSMEAAASVTPAGHAKLSDLGLAGPVWGDAETDPRFGKIVGTADYLSPDHILAPWTPLPVWDIYSLGCTFYYAVTGKVPFPGGTTTDKIRAACELQPLDPRRLNPRLTAEFVAVLADMMAKDPSRRTPTAEAVVARLAPWTGAPVSLPIGDDEAESSSELFSHAPAPVVKTPASPNEPDPSQLKDTVASFPEIPEHAPGQKDYSGESSQTTHPVDSASQETAAAVEPFGDRPPRPLPIFHPLVVLVLFPLLLVGLVMLLGWALRLLQ